MKKKQLLILLIIGVITTILGSYLKIMDYNYATLLLSIGLVVESTAILLFALRSIKDKNSKNNA